MARTLSRTGNRRDSNKSTNETRSDACAIVRTTLSTKVQRETFPTDQFPFLVSVSESRDLQAAIGVQDRAPPVLI